MIRVAYLINQYPKLSHSFIRREILALEAAGVEVVRIAIRADETRSLDPQDAEELARTRYLLGTSLAEIGLACLQRALRSPAAFVRTFARAIKLGLRSDVGVLKHAAYFVEACLLARWLDREGLQHVHAHFGTNATTVAMLSKQLGGVAYSFTVHGPEEFDRPKPLALREKIDDADFVVAISSFCRSQLFRWSRFPDWSKIKIVRCALDPSYFETTCPPVTDRPQLVSVGRLSEEKGQILAVRAARLLVDRGLTFELLLVGDGPLRAVIEEEIRQLSLGNVVRILGWKDNPSVRRLLLDSRALVVASFAEGLPVAIMEAFALGRPVISTSIAGIPELVQNGANGWLIPAGDVDRLAEAMQRALGADARQLLQLGENGHRCVRELHDATKEAGKLRELFGGALGRRGNASPSGAPSSS